jgi:hypothetical protein
MCHGLIKLMSVANYLDMDLWLTFHLYQPYDVCTSIKSHHTEVNTLFPPLLAVAGCQRSALDMYVMVTDDHNQKWR